CGSAIATSSMATEMVIGKSVQEALALTNRAVAEALDGLPPIKMHCSLLAEQAVKAALKEYYEQHGLMDDEARKMFDILDEDADEYAENLVKASEI
ncbi:MAG: iron-sulfur cluster assembly scaffold protein, partial [Clostridiaceae bacterium]|nr:iron-sulfur cluster assembly scaffold protein [Clostridiaceae bacterium]